MNKITRKLFISVLTLAFALVTLGATTFAWFTLTSTVTLSPINLNVDVGAGLEVSIDGVNYRSRIDFTQDKFYHIKNGSHTGLAAPYTLAFDAMSPVTTENGYQMLKLEANGDNPVTTEDGYVEFGLYFRSPSENAQVYLAPSTAITSEALAWTPDVSFTYRSEPIGPENETGTISIFAGDAMRYSFEEHNYVLDGVMKFEPLASRSAFVFEPQGTVHNIVLDTTLPAASSGGLVDYWHKKTTEDILTEDKYYKPTLPVNVKVGNDGIGLVGAEGTEPKTTLVTLTKDAYGGASSNYYYNFVVVKVWLEGWDSDNFDALMKAQFTIALSFSVYVDPTQTP